MRIPLRRFGLVVVAAVAVCLAVRPRAAAPPGGAIACRLVPVSLAERWHARGTRTDPTGFGIIKPDWSVRSAANPLLAWTGDLFRVELTNTSGVPLRVQEADDFHEFTRVRAGRYGRVHGEVHDESGRLVGEFADHVASTQSLVRAPFAMSPDGELLPNPPPAVVTWRPGESVVCDVPVYLCALIPALEGGTVPPGWYSVRAVFEYATPDGTMHSVASPPKWVKVTAADIAGWRAGK